MTDEQKTMHDWHRKQAIKLFNAAWDLIDKKNRTRQDELAMIHMAHASRYHWGQVGGVLEAARGEWQVSRVYSILRMGESALFHARESLRLSEENNIGGFDLAFGYEAVARAYKVLDRRESDIYKDRAIDEAQKIESREDREYVMEEIDGI
jgi:hypothetical protein